MTGVRELSSRLAEWNWIQIAARVGLAAWVLFWTWFVASDMAAEGVAREPILALVVLWSVGVVAWCWPRLGVIAMAGLCGYSLWLFANGPALWMIAVPAAALALLGWLGARHGARRAAPPDSAAGCPS